MAADKPVTLVSGSRVAVGSFALWHAVDLIKIELYALVATSSVIAFSRLGNMVIVARENADSLNRLNERKSILLRELAHSVANNFASVAALISVRSTTLGDAQASPCFRAQRLDRTRLEAPA